VHARTDKLKDPPAAAGGRASTFRLVGLSALVLLGAGALALTLLRPPAPTPPAPFADAPIRMADPVPAPANRDASPPASGARSDGGPTRLAPAPDPRLVERTQHGMLPRIGADGSRPSRVYARPAGPIDASAPRIALLVSGLGIGRSATAEAIAKLPEPVTLAFAPYGEGLDEAVAKAREQGHEVMLQVPMEPFDYPDSDPGPHTLTAEAGGRENIDRLHWVMGRFTGYVGLVNLMGGKLMADPSALKPILDEIAARGLLFLDDASVPRKPEAGNAPPRRADLVLDAVARPEAIDAELKRLEGIAREKGLAVGTARALPVTVERIALWAKELTSAGIELVPISHAIEGQATR
jgi:polysaccharide deacetylase 2 family uncharacterized protein YibQ